MFFFLKEKKTQSVLKRKIFPVILTCPQTIGFFKAFPTRMHQNINFKEMSVRVRQILTIANNFGGINRLDLFLKHTIIQCINVVDKSRIIVVLFGSTLVLFEELSLVSVFKKVFIR